MPLKFKGKLVNLSISEFASIKFQLPRTMLLNFKCKLLVLSFGVRNATEF